MRHELRAKLQRAVEDVMAPMHAAQQEELQRLRGEIGSLERQVVRLQQRLSDVQQEVQRAADRVNDHTTGFEIRTRRDMLYAGESTAAREGAEFLRQNLPGARHFEHPHATLEYGLTLARRGGMALEFGVWSGTTLKIIAEARDGQLVYGFDSFEGLPEDWRAGFPAGTFAADGMPDVPGAQLVPGLFADVLPGFLESHPGPVDFLHVDSDLYSSAVTVLDHVGSRLRSGSIIVFDEFFNYPGWREHEYRAWIEYVQRTGVQFRYEAFTHDGEQMVLTVTEIPAGA